MATACTNHTMTRTSLSVSGTAGALLDGERDLARYTYGDYISESGKTSDESRAAFAPLNLDGATCESMLEYMVNVGAVGETLSEVRFTP